MTDDSSCIRNEVAKDRTLREAREIASDMGLTFVRTLTHRAWQPWPETPLTGTWDEGSAAPTW